MVQLDLDGWMREYNKERAHSGPKHRGRSSGIRRTWRRRKMLDRLTVTDRSGTGRQRELRRRKYGLCQIKSPLTRLIAKKLILSASSLIHPRIPTRPQHEMTTGHLSRRSESKPDPSCAKSFLRRREAEARGELLSKELNALAVANSKSHGWTPNPLGPLPVRIRLHPPPAGDPSDAPTRHKKSAAGKCS